MLFLSKKKRKKNGERHQINTEIICNTFTLIIYISSDPSSIVTLCVRQKIPPRWLRLRGNHGELWNMVVKRQMATAAQEFLITCPPERARKKMKEKNTKKWEKIDKKFRYKKRKKKNV